MFWSGRRDLNSGPPAPKAGALPETTFLFSTLLLKQNNLTVIVACGWLCANVPVCPLGGHKSWHNRDGAPAREGLPRPPNPMKNLSLGRGIFESLVSP